MNVKMLHPREVVRPWNESGARRQTTRASSKQKGSSAKFWAGENTCAACVRPTCRGTRTNFFLYDRKLPSWFWTGDRHALPSACHRQTPSTPTPTTFNAHGDRQSLAGRHRSRRGGPMVPRRVHRRHRVGGNDQHPWHESVRRWGHRGHQALRLVGQLHAQNGTHRLLQIQATGQNRRRRLPFNSLCWLSTPGTETWRAQPAHRHGLPDLGQNAARPTTSSLGPRRCSPCQLETL